MDRKMEIKNPATEQEKIKAEMEGFEPSHRLPACRISSAVPSASWVHLHIKMKNSSAA